MNSVEPDESMHPVSRRIYIDNALGELTEALPEVFLTDCRPVFPFLTAPVYRRDGKSILGQAPSKSRRTSRCFDLNTRSALCSDPKVPSVWPAAKSELLCTIVWRRVYQLPVLRAGKAT